MFNSTHTLVGLIVAKTGVGKWARYGITTAVIASNLPDIDSIAGFWGTATYLEHHRGLTHSLIGVPVLSLLLSAVISVFSGKFGKTYAIALIAMATHPALDYLNPYGVRPFLPWNSKWYYGDLLFIFDPYLDTILALGLAVSWYRPRLSRLALLAAVVAGGCYIGVRMELHEKAASLVRPFLERVGGAENFAVLPTMSDPRQWTVVLQSSSEIYKLDVDTSAPDKIETAVTRIGSGPRSEIVTRAALANNAAAILRFARFPITRVEQLPSGYRVRFFDFRFYQGDSSTALGAEVILDRSLAVVKDSLSFVQPLAGE